MYSSCDKPMLYYILYSLFGSKPIKCNWIFAVLSLKVIDKQMNWDSNMTWRACIPDWAFCRTSLFSYMPKLTQHALSLPFNLNVQITLFSFIHCHWFTLSSAICMNIDKFHFWLGPGNLVFYFIFLIWTSLYVNLNRTN